MNRNDREMRLPLWVCMLISLGVVLLLHEIAMANGCAATGAAHHIAQEPAKDGAP